MNEGQMLANELQQICLQWEQAKLSYARAGIICCHVEKHMLWKGQAESFDRWLRQTAVHSYSTCRAAMADVKELHDVPVEEVAKIPTSNFSTVKQLSTKVRNDPHVLKVAQTQSTEKLVEHVQKYFPDQHVEPKTLFRVQLDESLHEKVETALKYAQMRGATTKAEALEMICEEAMGSWLAEDEIENIIAKQEGRATIQ